MTVREVITRCDALQPNPYTNAEKLRWLSQLEGLLHKLILSGREGSRDQTFVPFDETTDPDTVLAAGHPFDEMYLHWLMTQIHYHNADAQRCNNASNQFQAAFHRFENYVNRNNLKVKCTFRYF